MTYSVKEIYYTLQGEGAQTGRAAVFLRFAGCNLWSGLEKDRGRATCQFCDTDFVGTDGSNGGKFSDAAALARAARAQWSNHASGKPYIVCTGGEPLLQLDAAAVAAFKAEGFEIGIETNGTLLPPAGIDWICVSPKAGAPLVQKTGDELKLVYPQTEAQPHQFENLAFHNFFLQPMDGPDRDANTQLALRYCMAHPKWRLSLQTHKLLGIP
jgi:7-carboxy-7-deazaguanine synthase (Cx14CxxC type)